MSTSSPNISNRHQDSGIPTYPRAQMQTPLRLSACLPVCQLDLCLHVRNTYKIGCAHTHACACVHVPMHRCLYLFVSISGLPTEDQLSVPYFANKLSLRPTQCWVPMALPVPVVVRRTPVAWLLLPRPCVSVNYSVRDRFPQSSSRSSPGAAYPPSLGQLTVDVARCR